MKTFIQKLPLTGDTSFVAKTFRTPHFEVDWHQHIEFEMILFTEGEGLSFIGNDVGEFAIGDIFLLASNVPHTFQKRQKDQITSAVVVQFKEDFWGDIFLNLPECEKIKQLFELAVHGLKVYGKSKELMTPIIKELEYATGFDRIIKLAQCLSIIEKSREFMPLSTHEMKNYSFKHNERIDRIFKYTIENFKSPITLAQIADLAQMSVPAFCSYFKKSTKKTYIDFLNEIRIGYSCKLLMDTPLQMVNICFESGYNTLANFNKQFMKVKKTTPSKYRSTLKGSAITN
jgi:AraC-like DNA-binding protein/quercetin dioxygenase-like cupin family protein